MTRTEIKPTNDIFNSQDTRIKEDIIRMILQYLENEGYNTSRIVLHDEANIKLRELDELHLDVKRIKKLIIEGDWVEVDKFSNKPFIKNHKSFLYAVYKQQYLEYVEHHELQKAFTFLIKRLKPLEHLQNSPNEFRDLCYLLTSKSIQEAPAFRNWEGIAPAREKLVEQLQNMISFESMTEEASVYVPPDRLLNLLRQSVAYQIEFSRYHPRVVPRILTLLHDYKSLVIPNDCEFTLSGHTGNIKCVEWAGDDGEFLLSGSSDNTIKIWGADGKFIGDLTGHISRIWDISSIRSGLTCASGGGDGLIKIWDIRSTKLSNIHTISGHHGDIYSIQYHPNNIHLVSGGYDKIVRLFDSTREIPLKTFSGHQMSVSTCIFNPIGNLIVSGSKDNTIKFWDTNSGLCIKTISSHLGEVTSVEMNSSGSVLLTSSKDNSIRLWDIRMLRPIRRFKGHQNTSKNFLKANFAGDSLIVSGSEDGRIYIWDADKGYLLRRLYGHDGIVYRCMWNSKNCRLASCSDDKNVKIWYFDENKPEELMK